MTILTNARRRRLIIAALAVLLALGFYLTQAGAGAKLQDPAGLRAAADGVLYRAGAQSLARSTDGGKSWQAVALPEAANKGTIATVASTAADKNALYLAGPGIGVLKSSDAGKTWSELTAGLPSANVVAFTPHSTQPDTVYAVVDGEGIYRSQDAGKSWRLMHKGPRAEARIKALVHTNMEGSMESGWLFAATNEGVYRTMDCFCLFELVGELGGAATAVTFDRETPAEVYAAVGQQVFRTTDGGQAWAPIGKVGAEVVALGHAAGTVYALQADGTLAQSKDDGGDWK
jgi:photosystem II stability/assembly factor-like uncharacterized protein